MTTLKLRRSLPPSRRPGTLAAAIVAGVVVAAALPAILLNYGPFAGGDSDSTMATLSVPAVLGRSATTPGIQQLEERVKANPQDFGAKLNLANSYLQAVRETGDPTLYARTDAVLADAAKLDPGNPELLATQGILALGRHQFTKALDLGKQALAADPERARYYGVVADAQIELGMYDEAVANLQEMVNRRPDFAAYSRIAYLRELYGDPEGAIEAMDFAIEAGATAPENVAWAQAQVGDLFFGLGRFEDATQRYLLAEGRLAGYPLALAGRARVAAANGDFERARSLYQQAFEQMPAAGYATALGEIAAKQGDGAAAERYFGTVRAIDALAVANGENTDLEFAAFLADHGSATEAVKKARDGYASRPSVHGADTLAWALYRNGEIVEAQRYAREALRIGSRDALVLFHAGMIEKAAGNTEEARALLQQVVNVNPRFSVLHAGEAEAALAELE